MQAAEIASRINQKKEMGCKALDVVYVDQGGQTENKIMRLLSEENPDELHINNNGIFKTIYLFLYLLFLKKLNLVFF